MDKATISPTDTIRRFGAFPEKALVIADGLTQRLEAAVAAYEKRYNRNPLGWAMVLGIFFGPLVLSRFFLYLSPGIYRTMYSYNDNPNLLGLGMAICGVMLFLIIALCYRKARYAPALQTAIAELRSYVKKVREENPKDLDAAIHFIEAHEPESFLQFRAHIVPNTASS